MKVQAVFKDRAEVENLMNQTAHDTEAIKMAHTFEGKLKSRGIQVSIDEINFSRVSYMAWNYQAPITTPISWSAPCGFGKSTMLKTWVTYNAHSNNILWGAIVALPKREQVKEFCESVNEEAGKLIACPLLGKGEEMTEELYLEQFKLQERAPVLVMTHKMLEIMVSQDKLNDFMTWIDDEGKSRRRINLFIDERPQFVDTPKLTITNIERLTELVRSVSIASNDYHKGYVTEVEKTAEKLKKELKRPISKGQRQTFKVNAISPLFEVPRELFYDWVKHSEVTGEDYSLLGTFTEAVKRGGTCESNAQGVGLFVGRVVWQKVTSMNTHILDGSAVNDMSYEVAPFNVIAPVVPEGAYSNLTIKNCYKHNLGKSFFSAHKEGFKNTVKLAKDTAKKHKSLLVVVYKQFYEKYKEELAQEIEQGKVMLKWFDDERASNDYRDCDAILFLGMLRKSPAFYIEQAKVIFNKDFEGDFNTRGGQNFTEKGVHDTYVSDLLTHRHQGASRVRPYKSKTAKTVYMFTTYEEIPAGLISEFEGATLEEWELPFSLTGKEKEPTSEERYLEFLKAGGFEKMKCSEVYKSILEISSKQFARIKKAPEVLEVMKESGYVYEGNSIVKD